MSNIPVGNTIAKTGFIMAAAIGSMQLLQPFIMDMYLPSMSAVAADLSVPISLVQLTISVLGFGFALGQLVAGPVSDSVGRRTPMFWALGLYIVASFIVWFCPAIPVYMVGRFLQGFAGAAMTVLSLAVLRDLYQGMQLIRASSRVMLIGSAAWFIGPAAGSLILLFTNWRGLSLLIAALGLAVGIFAWRTLPETKTRESRNEKIFSGMGHRFGAVLRDRAFQGYATISAAIGIGMFGYLGILPQLFAHAYGLGAQVGYFISIGSVTAYLGVQVGSRLAQLWQPQWVLTAGLSLALLSGVYLMLIANQNPSVWAVEVGLATWTFVFGVTATPIQALAFTPHGEEAGTAAAVLGFLGAMGPALAGPYLTTLARTSSYGIGFNLLVCMGMALMAILVFVRPWKLAKLN